MTTDRLQVWIAWAAVLLILAWLTRLAVGVWRARTAGWSGVAIGTWVTVAVIGQATSIAVAVAGARLVYVLLPPTTTPTVGILAQVGGALILADVVARVYFRWLADPIGRWFHAEEAQEHG